MHWRDYLAVMAGLLIISWLRTVWAPSAEVATALLVSIVLVGAFLRRYLRRRKFRRLAELTEAERDVAISDLPSSDAALARLGFEVTYRPENLANLPAESRFPYRRGSRSLNSYLFWSCILLAAGIMVPVVLGRIDEPATGWVWASLAAVLVLSGWGYRAVAKELDSVLVIDRQGVALEGTEHQDIRLGWLEIAWVRSVVVPGGVYRALVLGTPLGKHLLIDTQIPQFDEAAELIAGKIVAIRGAT